MVLMLMIKVCKEKFDCDVTVSHVLAKGHFLQMLILIRVGYSLQFIIFFVRIKSL